MNVVSWIFFFFSELKNDVPSTFQQNMGNLIAFIEKMLGKLCLNKAYSALFIRVIFAFRLCGRCVICGVSCILYLTTGMAWNFMCWNILWLNASSLFFIEFRWCLTIHFDIQISGRLNHVIWLTAKRKEMGGEVSLMWYNQLSCNHYVFSICNTVKELITIGQCYWWQLVIHFQ